MQWYNHQKSNLCTILNFEKEKEIKSWGCICHWERQKPFKDTYLIYTEKWVHKYKYKWKDELADGGERQTGSGGQQTAGGGGDRQVKGGDRYQATSIGDLTRLMISMMMIVMKSM